MQASTTCNTFVAFLIFEARSSILCIDPSCDFILEIASRDSNRDIDIGGIIGVDDRMRRTRRVCQIGRDIGVKIAAVPRRIKRTWEMQQRSGVDAFPARKQTRDMAKENRSGQEAIGNVVQEKRKGSEGTWAQGPQKRKEETQKHTFQIMQMITLTHQDIK